MIKIDLITGFLGSGKTTFIKYYAARLADEGKKIGIIENDNGAINVDRLLLEENLGDSCDLEMVIGGDGDACRQRRLKSKLIAMGMLGYDRILIEPSGIFDVDELMDILHESPLDHWYVLGNVITIIDATMPMDHLSEAASYMLSKQAADAGTIVLSHAENLTDDGEAAIVDKLNAMLADWKCSRSLTEKDVFVKHHLSDLTTDDADRIAKKTASLYDLGRRPMGPAHFTTYFMMDYNADEATLKEKAKATFDVGKYGGVFRVKGFVPDGDKWLELNATEDAVTVSESDVGQAVIIFVGENMQLDALSALWGAEVHEGDFAHDHD